MEQWPRYTALEGSIVPRFPLLWGAKVELTAYFSNIINIFLILEIHFLILKNHFLILKSHFLILEFEFIILGNEFLILENTVLFNIRN